MDLINYLTDDALIMTITTNFRQDFKRMMKHFNVGFDIEFPELNFVYKTFRKTAEAKKRNIAGCTKLKIIFDMERGERYVVSYPMVNIYPTFIAEYIKKFHFKNETAAYIYFARITLLHELIHYFQLASKVFISELIGKVSCKFDDSVNSEVIETLEYMCVKELQNILNIYYSSDLILLELGKIESLDYRYLFNKIEFDDYEENMSKILDTIDNLLL